MILTCISKLVQPHNKSLRRTNIVYIMRKELDTEKVKKILEKLSLILEIVNLKADDLKRASALDFKDYKDAIQSTQASSMKANYIITRNIKDYSKTK